MKYTILGIKLILIAYLCRLLFFLATAYNPANVPMNPPFGIFAIDTINLFIHEAGHFFFKIFGRWLYFLGGSLFQILLPLALTITTWRSSKAYVAYPAFWSGESMINVSVYIKDAPFRKLHLIAKGLIHDWNWLLSDNLELATPLGSIVYYMGLLVCSAGVVGGIAFAIINYQTHVDGVVIENQIMNG
jgi:hypothetical protein